MAASDHSRAALTEGPRRALVLVFGLYILFGSIFTVVFPLGAGPDEQSHFLYVRYIARQGRLPILRPRLDDSPTAEAYQAPGYYLLGAVLTYPWVRSEPLLDGGPALPGQGKEPLFRHAEGSAFPWSGGTLAWHLLRFISLGLGAVSLWAAFASGRLLFEDSWMAVACSAYLALNPQFVYVHSLVTNDAAASSAGSLLLWLTIRTVVRKRFFARWTAAVLAAAVLAKSSVLLLTPVLAWAVLRTPGVLRDRTSLGRLIRWCLPSLLVAGALLLRNLVLYGDLTGMAMSRRANVGNYYSQALSWAEFLRRLPQMIVTTFRSSWASFGWMSFEIPRRIFNPLAMLHLAAWTAFFAALLRGRWGRSGRLMTASALILLGGFFFYNFHVNEAGWQGRLMAPGCLSFAVAFVGGWSVLLRGRGLPLAVSMIFGQTLLLTYCLFAIILPIFSP